MLGRLLSERKKRPRNIFFLNFGFGIMSEENEGEEDKPKDDFSWSEEFDFYFPFTKPLVLDLPTEEDRVLASAWVQKLEAEPESDEEKKVRLNYLKLLLFTLQRGQLSGIFRKEPPSGPLEPFPQGFSIFDMANWMLEEDDTPTCGGGDAGHVPYTIEMSNDLREFIASQEIPNFGVQMYYAWSSDEAIDKWSFFDEEKFPQYILDKIKQLQESKSDEKSFLMKTGCMVKKKGCNLAIPEKYSQKKVKSPQEIERSQGRSFHTYMGLIGRMGNFNDKCDDDPNKFQRQDQRKGKVPRRNDPKKCPGSGGEAEEDEEFDNPAPNLGGLDSINRPCLCPFPCHHPACPEHHLKGEPQSYDDRRTPDRNCGFNHRTEAENSPWTSTVTKSLPPSRRLREQCLENETSMGMPSQKRSVSPRPRSSSPNQPNLDCPQQDNSGEFPNSAVCTCSTPQCPCPCPRISQKISVHQTPSTSRGRGGTEPSRTHIRTGKQNPPCNDSRGTGTYLNSLTAPDPCSPMSRRSDLSPVGGRTGTSPALRPVQPEVIHCYDNQNPDPALTKRVEANSEWIPLNGGNRFVSTDFKMGCRRDHIIAAAQQNKCKVGTRRELFSSQQQSTSPPPHSDPCQQPSGTSRRSPPLESHPSCDYSPPEEEAGPCPSGQQRMYPQQNYLECEDPAPPQTCYGFHEPCGRQAADTYQKPGPQTTSRLKNAPNYYPTSFPVRNEGGRLTDMSNVLKGIKQKTEAHREKCTQMRSPVSNMRPENRVCHPPQAQDGPPRTPPNQRNRGYAGLLPPDCQPGSPYPGYFPERVGNYQQDECDLDYEEDDECQSSESLEACPQGISPIELPKNVMQTCQQHDFNERDDCEEVDKTMTQESYGVNFAEYDQCPEPKFVTLGNYSPDADKTTVSGVFDANNYMDAEDPNCAPQTAGRAHHRTPMNGSPRDCRYQRTSPKRTTRPEACMNVTPRDCKNMAGEGSGRVPQPQWTTPKVSGNRYFNASFESRSGRPCPQPRSSTPKEKYSRNYKDQGTDGVAPNCPPSNRCA